MKNFYITTPIYYVNDKPHIGHAYTSIVADVIARFKRLDGVNVKFLTGTDEHGQKVEKSSIDKGMSPQDFVDQVSEQFRALGPLLNLSNDDFIRTTEERHKKAVKFLWQRLLDAGHIYKGAYAGWYSVRDEAFYAESELIDGKAPTGAPVEWVEEDSYFFDLSHWQEALIAHLEANPDFVWPKSRYNEVMNFVKSGLKDLSISRISFKWGIEVPRNAEGDENHVIYVWLDALANYISAVGFPDALSEDYVKFWPADVHVIGKDITRFHAVYWPAFLMAAALPLPKQILTHGWWTNEGQKISKSLGNVIDPVELVNQFGLDQTRYFLMKEVNFGSDGNFSKQGMKELINADLANNLGNLVQRTMSMIFKNCNQSIPNFDLNSYLEHEILIEAQGLYGKVKKKFEKHEYSAALEILRHFASILNGFIDSEAPWILKKTDFKKMEQVLYVLAESIRILGILLQAFTPQIAAEILKQLGRAPANFSEISKEFALKPGAKIIEPKGIIPRIEEEI